MSTDHEAFREQVRSWLAEHLAGEWAPLKGVGGSGGGEVAYEERRAWNHHLAEHGWTCLGWAEEHGGRGLSLTQQAIFHEEYARADGPELINHLGEQLLGPTLIEFGTDEQKRRFLPGIRTVDELWCQGYSEPGAGSDLAAVSTRAVLDEAADEWVVDGQKVWTSWAQKSDWIFVIARTVPGSSRHHGLSFLLMPLDQDGVEIRPIVQITGGTEFNEVFFSGARTPAGMVVGEPGEGWRVAMALLEFERGVSVLGQQVGFERELNDLIDLARSNGALDDPVLRDRLAAQSAEFEVMRINAVRSLTEATPGRTTSPSSSGPDGTSAWASWPWRFSVPGRSRPGGGVRPRPLAEPLPLLPRRHALRRQRRDPAQHPGRARARPPQGGPRMTTMRPEQPTPDYVPGHDLLAGKVVVVTAAAGAGIGAAVARRALEEGASLVVISDTHERRLAESQETLAAEFGEKRVRALAADVTDEAQVQALLDVADEHGGVDVMINNAGLGGTADVLEMTDEEWSRVLDITLTGTFRCVRAAGNRMKAAGKHGVIVNNASVIGWRAQEGQAHYAAAKAGVMALTRCAALDVARHGIRVNAVSPSLAMHPFLAKVTSDELLAELKQREAFGRAAEPWEVANVMVFLASDYSSYLTGEVVSVSGPNMPSRSRPPRSAESC